MNMETAIKLLEKNMKRRNIWILFKIHLPMLSTRFGKRRTLDSEEIKEGVMTMPDTREKLTDAVAV